MTVHCINQMPTDTLYLHNHTYHHYNVPKTNENPEVAKISEKLCKLFTYRYNGKKGFFFTNIYIKLS